MSNETETPTPNYDGHRTVLLTGGEPGTKPIPQKVIQPRMPQLSNRDDIAAIHNGRAINRGVEAVADSLRQLLSANQEYLPVAQTFVRKLSEEIANPTDPDAAA